MDRHKVLVRVRS